MARRPELVVDGQTNADAAYMNTILDALGDLLLLKKELGDGSAESVIDILNKFPGSSSLNLLLNPHFDVYDSNGNLRYWTAFASSVSQISTSTDNSLGHDFVKITTDGSGNNAGIKQTTAESSILSKWLNIVKAQQLYLSFKVKVRSSVPVSVAINDTVVNSAGNGTWEEVIVKRKFTGTETDISAQIYLPGTTNTAATDIEVGEATLVIGSTISNVINQGINSGLDADTLDGLHMSQIRGIGFKNRIINGDFSVWQRGTTFTFGASQWGYTADRFAVSNSADGQFTASKSSVNGENALRITVDTPPTDLTGANHWHGIRYIFEGQHLYHLAIRKKSITISFTFNSNVSGEFPVAIRNLIDPSNTQSYVTTFTYISGSPKKVIVTIPIDIPDNLNPTFQKDENMGFDLVIGYLGDGGIAPSKNQWVAGTYATTSTAVNWASTAGNFIEITKLQVEEGNTATEFEYVPYDVQLLRCMRYYEDGGFYAGAPGHANINVRLNQVFFKVKKRALPTITLSIINTNGIDSVWTEEVATESFGIAGHLTVDHPWISASWTADAEL